MNLPPLPLPPGVTDGLDAHRPLTITEAGVMLMTYANILHAMFIQDPRAQAIDATLVKHDTGVGFTFTATLAQPTIPDGDIKAIGA